MSKIKLEFGSEHAKENNATHHRQGDIYKVTEKVECWDLGRWVETENCRDLKGWLRELTEIDFDNSI